MKEQQVGYTFWGRPLYGLERRTAVSIDCACGELIQQNIQTKQYHCENCGLYFLGTSIIWIRTKNGCIDRLCLR
ncbi:hypothetical protein [Enterococcus mundtii]|uniref:hypothetical protein n=1 Tax=Enterococcus mundtii TaxID=53346 RepID=UPI000F7EA29F|nr:hypothetical protein [Enterococcus mundtii]